MRPLRCGPAGAITSCGFCGFRGASSRSSGSRNGEPMYGARLLASAERIIVFISTSLPWQEDAMLHRPSSMLGRKQGSANTTIIASIRRIFALEPCSASRDLPLGEVSPVASLLSPKRDRTLHSAVSCSSSFLGLNLQSFHLPIPNANPSRAPSQLSHVGCSWLLTDSALCSFFSGQNTIN